MWFNARSHPQLQTTTIAKSRISILKAAIICAVPTTMSAMPVSMRNTSIDLLILKLVLVIPTASLDCFLEKVCTKPPKMESTPLTKYTTCAIKSRVSLSFTPNASPTIVPENTKTKKNCQTRKFILLRSIVYNVESHTLLYAARVFFSILQAVLKTIRNSRNRCMCCNGWSKHILKKVRVSGIAFKAL